VATKAEPEERIKLLLASEDPGLRAVALGLVRDQYRPALAAEFHQRFPEHSDEDFADSWDRVLGQLARLVNASRFDAGRSLHRWLALALAEEPLKRLLAGRQPAEWTRGLSLVAVLYEQPVHAVIRSRWPDLSEADRANVWQETLGGLLRKVRAGAFERDGPLLGYLLGIVRHKVADFYRGRAALEKVLNTIAQGRTDSTCVEPEKQLEAQEFCEILRRLVGSLPPREQQVVRAYLDGFPDTRDMSLLLQKVEEASGHVESLSAIKVNLSRGKKRLGDYLRSRGYGVERGDA
jgi:DNA-directed RNA polymerase specialized sigma24 family protein